MMKVWKHFCTVNTHKWLVFKGCAKVGLYKQGITHDLSKYSLTEFWIGCKYFKGTESPNNGERREKGYSSSWLHHKGRNKHHYEYWIDYDLEKEKGVTGMKMPEKYVVEMLMDRIAAAKVYEKEKYTDESPLRYFRKGKKYLVIHKESGQLIESLLERLAKDGEKNTFSYIKKELLKR